MKNLNRFIIYILGMFILSIGITLTTKTSLGTSPIISIPYSLSQIWSLNFGNTCFILYVFFVILEFILRGKNYRIYDLFQIPVCLLFTRLLNLFSNQISSVPDNIILKLFVLFAAIILTGIGAAITLDMKLVPNPADGLVQTIAETAKISTGLSKNIFDLSSVVITLSISLIFAHTIVGIGLGTIITMIGVGRVIALFNYLLFDKLQSCIAM